MHCYALRGTDFSTSLEMTYFSIHSAAKLVQKIWKISVISSVVLRAANHKFPCLPGASIPIQMRPCRVVEKSVNPLSSCPFDLVWAMSCCGTRCSRRRQAASSLTVRLGCPISSLPLIRLRQLSTPAHACPLAVSATGSARVRVHCHSLRSLAPPPAALPSLPLRGVRKTSYVGFFFGPSRASAPTATKM